MRKLTFKHALTPRGIATDCEISFDEAGRITAVGQGAGPYDGDFALPALGNAHSHAFQRALAGHGEGRGGDDSFWRWREAMYALANRLDADEMYTVARLAYSEMLAAGFTAVAEFHYLHHLKDGARGTAMADAVIQAARDTGIRLRLLPVYYHAGGFGRPAGDAQRRFTHASVDEFLKLVDSLAHAHLGIAIHSLRAVPLEHLKDIVAQRAGALFHVHVSEQQAEVDQCVAVYGKRPVELLADTVELDANWTLVHATHADASERASIRNAGACVALCPLTEAYLGDGLFAATEFHAQGGVLAIGTDSNARIDAIEELRWLEYGQRLRDQRRARLADESGVGAPLWQAAAAGGAHATGFAVGRIEVGAFADLVVLDESGAPWFGVEPARWLDAWLTGGSRHDIAHVYVGGKAVT
ncbi:MAG: formimidoylglutamate deiminase [Gammaproteobacteria bacterium]